MKAAYYHTYGPPDVLEFKEVERPSPKDDEVLVKIKAASLNSWDWDLLRGEPFLVRLAGGGIAKPKINILGCDIAGIVEAIGKNGTRFKIGDEVFGDLSACGWGGLAEYVCAPENALTRMSASMTFQQAAAIPQAGVMALQGIRDYGKVKHGQKVLINGAGGGVGTFAIQLAKYYGTEVTAVDNIDKFEMMRSLGADHLMDYKQVDFIEHDGLYDLIIDMVANHSILDYKRVLRPTGIFVMVGGTTSTIFQTMLFGPLLSVGRLKKLRVLMHEPNKNLESLKELFETGSMKPIIDKCFKLSETAAAMQYLGDGKAQGKVVITM